MEKIVSFYMVLSELANLNVASLALALHMTEGEGDKWRIIIILDRAAVTPRRVGNILQQQNYNMYTRRRPGRI